MLTPNHINKALKAYTYVYTLLKQTCAYPLGVTEITRMLKSESCLKYLQNQGQTLSQNRNASLL